MHFEDHVEDEAKELAGNWKKFRDFGWHEKPEESPENWCIIYTSHRDTVSCLTKSNEAVVLKELAEFEDDFQHEVHNHWGHGWVEGFSLRVYNDEGKITDAFRKYVELKFAAQDGPLDDDDYNDRQYDAQIAAIEYHSYQLDAETFPEDWAEQVREWIRDAYEEELEETSEGVWVSEDKVKEACIDLGFMTEEDEDEDGNEN